MKSNVEDEVFCFNRKYKNKQRHAKLEKFNGLTCRLIEFRLVSLLDCAQIYVYKETRLPHRCLFFYMMITGYKHRDRAREAPTQQQQQQQQTAKEKGVDSVCVWFFIRLIEI